MSIEIFQSNLLLQAGFPTHGFTKRTGGVSRGPFASLNLAFDVGDEQDAVKKNLQLLRTFIGREAPLARVKQVHGNRIAEGAIVLAESPDLWSGEPVIEADGIVNQGLDVILAVQNADCAPVLLTDLETGTYAAVHAGWRGTARGVLQNSVRAILHHGANLSNIIAAIGPCVCPKCYEVGSDVARHFPESVDPILRNPGKFHLDLGHAVEVSLIGAGLSSRNIDRLDVCSQCSSASLFSRRRDGEPTGRFIGYIGPASAS